MALLEVKNLKVDFATQDGTVHAVRDLSYTLEKGRTLAIVGESGSGKTQGAFALLGLLPRQGGHIFWNGEEVGDPATFFVPPRSAYTWPLCVPA